MKKHTKIIIVLGAIAVVLFLGVMSPRMSNGLSLLFAEMLKKTLGSLPGGFKSLSYIDSDIRKIAHFAEYLILTTIIYSALNYKIKKKIVIVAITLSIVGAISFLDEAFIQRIFSHGRTVSIYDIVYDMLGGLTSILNIFIINTAMKIHNRSLKDYNKS